MKLFCLIHIQVLKEVFNLLSLILKSRTLGINSETTKRTLKLNSKIRKPLLMIMMSKDLAEKRRSQSDGTA